MSIISNYNLQRINTKELSDNLNATIDFGGNILLVARRGTGKTMITSQVIKKSKYKEIYMNLSLFERPDLGGYPSLFSVGAHERFVKFLLPMLYQHLIEGDTPCVAVLDEVDKAEAGVLAPLLELIDKRTINGTLLKNLHAVVMTGNLPSEGGQKPHETLLDRTEKYLVETDYRHWLDWGAETCEIHPTISAYIAENPDKLCGKVNMANDAFADESPRSWHYTSRLIKFGERNNWSSKLIMQKIAGCVGKEAASEYETFFNYYVNLSPIINKILIGDPVPELKTFDNSKQFVICMMVCLKLSNILDKFNSLQKPLDDISLKISSNVSKFMCGIDPDTALISIRSQLGAKRIAINSLLDDKNWNFLLEELFKTINQ